VEELVSPDTSTIIIIIIMALFMSVEEDHDKTLYSRLLRL